MDTKALSGFEVFEVLKNVVRLVQTQGLQYDAPSVSWLTLTRQKRTVWTCDRLETALTETSLTETALTDGENAV